MSDETALTLSKHFLYVDISSYDFSTLITNVTYNKIKMR